MFRWYMVASLKLQQWRRRSVKWFAVCGCAVRRCSGTYGIHVGGVFGDSTVKSILLYWVGGGAMCLCVLASGPACIVQL